MSRLATKEDVQRELDKDPDHYITTELLNTFTSFQQLVKPRVLVINWKKRIQNEEYITTSEYYRLTSAQVKKAKSIKEIDLLKYVIIVGRPIPEGPIPEPKKGQYKANNWQKRCKQGDRLSKDEWNNLSPSQQYRIKKLYYDLLPDKSSSV
jgi:hypothetical protein